MTETMSRYAPYFVLATRMDFLFACNLSSRASLWVYAVLSSEVSWCRSAARPLTWPIS